jgi:hypothetical protein
MAEKLTDIDGIGPKTADDLREQGIDSPGTRLFRTPVLVSSAAREMHCSKTARVSPTR